MPSDVIAVSAVAVALITLGWQIWRETRKDRAEAQAKAIEVARADALLEDRVRRLEDRERDNDED